MLVDAVDEYHAGLGYVVSRAHQPFPQLASTDRAYRLAVEVEWPVCIASKGGHERVGHKDREVKIAKPSWIALRIDECLDVGMIDAQAAHHGASALPCRLHRPTHGIPAIHERQGPGCLSSHAEHGASRGADSGKVHAHAASLLHRKGGLLQMFEDAAEAVGDRAHDEAVEERNAALGTGAGKHASRRYELHAFNGVVEARLPTLPLLRSLGRRNGASYTLRGFREAGVAMSLRGLEAILRRPNFFRKRYFEAHNPLPMGLPGERGARETIRFDLSQC